MGCGCEIAGIEELSDQWSRIPRMKFQVDKSDKALKIQSESVHHHFGAMVPGRETPSRDHASDREEAERFKAFEDLGDRLFKGSIC